MRKITAQITRTVRMNSYLKLNRRKFILGLSAAFLSGCSGNYSGQYILDGFKCTADLPRGTRVYPIRIRKFERLYLEEQEGLELCWAAAIQAVYMYVGIDISQERIVDKIRDTTKNKRYSSATLNEILDGFGGNYSSWHVTNGIGNQLITDLMRGSVVILGLKNEKYKTGHVVVAYGATYVKDYNNTTYIDQVMVWDPYIGEGFKRLSGCRVKDEIKFAIHPRVLG
ncbi:MAG: hypothetical protein ACI9LM_004945 [Alteromonadaceae bacterium]